MGLLRWANAFSALNDGAAIRKRKARQREPAGSPEDQHLRRGVFFSFDSPAVSGSALALPQDARRGAVWRDWIPLPGWGGSNEAKATTGSDALNGLDGACADGYRGRRLPDWNSNNGRHSGVLLALGNELVASLRQSNPDGEGPTGRTTPPSGL
jgi:hypothetical protein